MTDTAADPRLADGVEMFTCINPLHPTKSCYGLVEDADEPRRKHREWHDSLVAKDEGQRRAIKARDDEIAKLHAAIAENTRVIESFRAEVARVQTPTPVRGATINRAGYTDDELADDTPDEADDDLELHLPNDTQTGTTTESALHASESDEDDEDDLGDHHTVPMPAQSRWGA